RTRSPHHTGSGCLAGSTCGRSPSCDRGPGPLSRAGADGRTRSWLPGRTTRECTCAQSCPRSSIWTSASQRRRGAGAVVMDSSDEFITFSCSPERDPDGSRFRSILTSHFAYGRARALRHFLVGVLAIASVFVWPQAVWPEEMPLLQHDRRQIDYGSFRPIREH